MSMRLAQTDGVYGAPADDDDTFSVIDRNSVFDGTFQTTRNLKVEGEVKGTIECKGTLFVAEGATVLVGGLRVLNVTAGDSGHGVLTRRPGVLTNDFFVNLIDMSTEWKPISGVDEFEGVSRKDKNRHWSASRVDLAFGSNGELRALSEVYASSDGGEKFMKDFVKAWDKVMMLDRFDVARA